MRASAWIIVLGLVAMPILAIARSDAGAPEVVPEEIDGVKVASQVDKQGDTTTPTLDELLQRDPLTSDYGESPRCIRTHNIRSAQVIDEKHIAFEMSRSKIFLVQLEHRCPGLRRGNPLMYEARSNQLCVHDSVRGSYSIGVGSYQPGMPCAIPKFESVTKEQLVLLKDALKVEKRKRRKRRKS